MLRFVRIAYLFRGYVSRERCSGRSLRLFDVVCVSRVHFVFLRSTYASDSLARARTRVFESLIHVDTFRCAQLYYECYDNHSNPTEVERLVKLGANGSGYKNCVRLLSRLSL